MAWKLMLNSRSIFTKLDTLEVLYDLPSFINPTNRFTMACQHHRPTPPCLPTQELNISFTRFGPFRIIETRTREDTHDLCELHHTW